jgi:hypothetical protein
LRSAIGPQLAGADVAGDREAELGLGIADGVATDDCDACLAADACRTLEDLVEDL